MFCSVKLTIYTLVLLAVTSVFGTVILQNGAPEQYIRLYGQRFYNVIRVFSLDDMYQAWWFLTLIVILCINIVVCSIERLSHTWKIIFPDRIRFNPDRFRKLKNLESFTMEKSFDSLSTRCEAVLTKFCGNVIKERTDSGLVMYAEKGRWTRIGVYVVHFSILLLLLGALIGNIFGFKANLRLDEGADSDTVMDAKHRAPIRLGFTIRCNDFDVKFYKNGAPEEYRSNLTIIENGRQVLTTDIRVNHPLRYKGINIFQASYGTIPSDSVTLDIIDSIDKGVITRVFKPGRKLVLPDNAGIFTLDGLVPHFDFMGHNLGQAFVGHIAGPDGKEVQIGLPMKYPSFDKMRRGRFAFVIKEFEKKYYTGLEVTKDPGIYYVYAGFIMIIIGCWITFFMSHQSWFIELEQQGDSSVKISLSGTSNRNPQGMKLKIRKLSNRLKEE